MRTVTSSAITEVIAQLCVQANTKLPADIVAALDRDRKAEPWPLAQETLNLLWDNMELAGEKNLPGHGDGLRLRGAGPGGPHRGQF